MPAEPEPGAYRPPRFEVDADERDGRLVLHVVGELDLVSEPTLTEALAQAAGRPVTLELEELAFMDSTGLRALLGSAREIPGLTLKGPLQAPVRRLLELTQTLAILPYEGP